MPVISLYRHGVTGGIAPRVNNHTRALRGDVGGWSPSSTRRNTRFLYSVLENELDGVGFAVTLTVRDCPGDSSTWHLLRRAWEARQRRAGMIRVHWVTEWQRRGVPHLHLAIWWPHEVVECMGAHNVKSNMINDWMMLTRSKYGSGFSGQHAHEITGVVGWFQYVSKHAARGMHHYQRSSENVPESWRLKTGRMWGKGGHWPVKEKVTIRIEDQAGDGGWFAYRRLVRSWRIADARADGDRARLRSAKRMLKCPHVGTSRVRGISEWIPKNVSLAMFQNLAGRGFFVQL